jgi:threonine aldolase
MSKGLGCPVGSVLIGSHEHMVKARRIRKVLGGGMRQAGYLAAAAIYALDHHIDRLKEDHLRARKISDILSGLNYVEEIMPVETNIVVFKLTNKLDLNQFLKKLDEMGIKAVAFGPQLVRFVTHLNFSDDDLNLLEKNLKKVQL